MTNLKLNTKTYLNTKLSSYDFVRDCRIFKSTNDAINDREKIKQGYAVLALGDESFVVQVANKSQNFIERLLDILYIYLDTPLSRRLLIDNVTAITKDLEQYQPENSVNTSKITNVQFTQKIDSQLVCIMKLKVIEQI